jgi:hypothetical protein
MRNSEALPDVSGHTQGVGDNGQRRAHSPAGGEERSVGDIEVVKIVSAVAGVEHARARVVTEAAGAADVAESLAVLCASAPHGTKTAEGSVDEISQKTTALDLSGAEAVADTPAAARGINCVVRVGRILEDAGDDRRPGKPPGNGAGQDWIEPSLRPSTQ